MAELQFRLLDLDGFADLLDSAAEHYEDYVIAVPKQTRDDVSHMPDNGLIRYGDYLYPATLLGGDHRPPEQDLVDLSFASSLLAPASLYNTDHERVLGQEEYRERVEKAAGRMDDPYVLIGNFSPGRNYRIYGGDSEKPRKASGLRLPRDAVSGAGNAWLNKAKVTLHGMLLIEGAALTQESREFARDERDHLDLGAAGEKQAMEQEEVIEALRGLETGDRLYINDRSTPLTVVPQSEADIITSTKTLCLLEGHGTYYRVEVFGEDRYPLLDYASDRKRITEVEVEKGEPEQADVEGVA